MSEVRGESTMAGSFSSNLQTDRAADWFPGIREIVHYRGNRRASCCGAAKLSQDRRLWR